MDRSITITGDDGKTYEGIILFTYHYDKTNKDYVVFQIKGSDTASAAIYHPEDGGNGELEKIETDDEWEMLGKLLEDYQDSLEDDDCDGNCEGCSGCDSCDR
jgi:uncharacterized protein YrzB (UPF0473 family)